MSKQDDKFSFFIFALIVIAILPSNVVESYRAVVVIHGILTGSDTMEVITNRIQEVWASFIYASFSGSLFGVVFVVSFVCVISIGICMCI